MGFTNLGKSQPKTYLVILFFKGTSRKSYLIKITASIGEKEDKTVRKLNSQKDTGSRENIIKNNLSR
jgi:hypothetical protein